MPFEDRYDWVMVQVQDLAKATSKLLAEALDKDPEELIELDSQTDALLEDAFEHSRIQVVDSRTAARILRPPPRIRAYAELLARKSALLHQLGDLRRSHGLARRALELRLEAAALEDNPETVDWAAIEALLDREPPLELGERHRRLLAQLDDPSQD